MNKAEFLQALEAGLAAASPEEKAAAIQYYTEYLDEAGPEREAEVLAELGNPEAVAAGILGSPQPQAAGTWTPPTPPQNGGWVPPEAPRAPEPPPQWRQADFDGASQSQNQPQYPYGAGNPYGQPQPPQQDPRGYNRRNNSVAKVIVIILAAIFVLPLLGGFGGVLFGLLVAAAVLFFVPIIAGIAFVASGVFVAICGGSILTAFLGSGLLTIGVGVALAGLGLLCLYAGGRLLGKTLPAVVRGAGNAIGGLWRRFTSAVGGRA